MLISLSITIATQAEASERSVEDDGFTSEPVVGAEFLECNLDAGDLACEVTSCGGTGEPDCEPDGSLPVPDCTTYGTPVGDYPWQSAECCFGPNCTHLECNRFENYCCAPEKIGYTCDEE